MSEQPRLHDGEPAGPVRLPAASLAPLFASAEGGERDTDDYADIYEKVRELGVAANMDTVLFPAVATAPIPGATRHPPIATSCSCHIAS